MKTSFITVPKGKCSLDVLAEMGTRTSRALICIDENCAKNLDGSANSNLKLSDDTFILKWNASDKFPKTDAMLRKVDLSDLGVYYIILFIDAFDIAFKYIPAFPDELLILSMTA